MIKDKWWHYCFLLYNQYSVIKIMICVCCVYTFRFKIQEYVNSFAFFLTLKVDSARRYQCGTWNFKQCGTWNFKCTVAPNQWDIPGRNQVWAVVICFVGWFYCFFFVFRCDFVPLCCINSINSQEAELIITFVCCIFIFCLVLKLYVCLINMGLTIYLLLTN